MRKRKKLLLVSVFMALLFLCTNGISQTWEVPIVVKGNGTTDTLYFGTDPAGTNGYDSGIDVLAPPPPPSGFYTAFYITGIFNYLIKDKRASTDTLINWTLITANATAMTDSIKWNPADLPATGDFTLDGQNMRTQSVLVRSGSINLTLTYRITTIPPTTIPIIVKGNGTTDTLSFGTDPAGTDGYDSGIDVLAPPPPPSGFYTAFYIGGIFPYLIKDIRASTDPHIIWTLITTNATGMTDSISWHPADLPAGTWIFDTVTQNINMKTESLAVYTGNQTLYLKYTTAPPDTHDVGPTVLISPPANIDTGVSYPVQVRVKNFGNTTETFNVACIITGWADTVTVTALAPKDSVVANFANWTTPTSGVFYMYAKTLLATDANPVNDSLGKTVGIEERAVIPTTYELSSGIPNPATNSVRIPYAIPQKSQVEIKVYNIAGELVRTLKSGVEEPGYKTAIWDMKDGNGKRVQSGIYFYKMQAGDFSTVKKMIVTK